MPFQFQLGPEITTGLNATCQNLPVHIMRGDTQQIMLNGRCQKPVTAGWGDIWNLANTTVTGTVNTRTLPTSGVALNICSDSATDTYNTGGATTVGVFYLDANYNPWYATYQLNGLTTVTVPVSIVNPFNVSQTLPAAAVTNCLRVNTVEVLSVFSVGITNVGNIFAFTGAQTTGVPNAGSNVFAFVAAGDNISTMSMFTIPNGYSGAIYQWAVSLSTSAATTLNGEVRAAWTTGANGPFRYLYLGGVSTGGELAILDPCFNPVLTPQSDVKFQAVASSATSADLVSLAAIVLWSNAN